MNRLAALADGAGRLVASLVVIAVVAGLVTVLALDTTKSGVAYFESVRNIYPNDRVRIQGVDVGQITAIEPEADRVRVEFAYDGKYDLPADVQAAVVSPTLVATRFLQLAPAYRGDGPTFPDDGEIPVERTVSPLEFDDLKAELQRVSDAFGPAPDGSQGVLGRFLDNIAENAEGGQGVRFNEAVRQASAAAETLASGREDIFGTVRNLQTFVAALGAIDDQIVEFNDRLGTVSGVLEENETALADAIAGVDRAAIEVDSFLADNAGPLRQNVDQVGQFTRTLATIRDEIAQVLHVGPNTITNLWQIFSPRTHAYSGALVVDNANVPADLICSAYAMNLAQTPSAAAPPCQTYLAPLLRVLRVQQPPIGVNPLVVPGGGGEAQNPGVNPPAAGRANNEAVPPDLGLPGLGGLILPEGGN